ncbi:MAG: hypothetical protein AAGK57_00350 [Pseudomonadota bacterium]
MPATLGHIGVQYLLSRGAIRNAGPKWILLGCILPDFPWIAQRLILALTDISPIPMRLYAIGQSSLAFGFLLAAAVALVSCRPRQVFAILALGVGMHLALDATQIKWGNGVVLWAPIHWSTTRFDLFWPEDLPSLGLLGLGLAMAIWMLLRPHAEPGDLRWPRGRAGFGAALCLVAYVLGPLATMPAVARADLHFTATISRTETRVGRPIEIDRNKLVWTAGEARLSTWFGETLFLTGSLPRTDGLLSLKGRFVAADRIHVTDHHVHPPGLRNWASMVGLAFVLFWWARVLWRLGRRVDL